jgi:two-component system chemotaxis sensor kinase CheA
MDDLLNEFLTETAESIAVIDVELVKFEQDPNDAEILQNIFRLVHTIKGTSGFLGLPRLEKVAHHGEDVLGKFRDGELEVTPVAVTLILKAIDTIKVLLAELEDTGSEPEGDDSEIIAELEAMAENRTADSGDTPVAEAEQVEQQPDETVSADAGDDSAAKGNDTDIAGPVADEEGFPVAKELLDEVEEAAAAGVRAASNEELAAEMEKERAAEQGASLDTESSPSEDANASAEAPSAPDDQKEAAVSAPQAPAAPNEKKSTPAKSEKLREPKESSVAAQSIRVNVDLLENLMTLVSEMVLTRNQLMQMVRGQDESEFHAPLQRLSLITTDLQEGVMKTRMQPIGNAWAKLPRIVRDLAVEAGKKIELKMLGADTELDRQVLEMIKDPLTHMVRNSADHGLETTEERQAANKPDTGMITLNAFHEGGHIVIEIADDGRGLNMERITTKLIDNGLATEAEIEGMTDQQIQQFIFKAGFSTAEKVTNVSGRGVGMDVVRTNIEKIGGTVELKSETGRGSTFTIKIPLTLAIVSALVVESAGERFAIPQIGVLELVRASAHSENTIEMINNAPVLRLRNRLLPLVSLRDLLKLSAGSVEYAESDSERLSEAQAEPEDGDAAVPAPVFEDETEKDDYFIVVSQVGTYTFGMIVDRVFDTEEIVVKPVAPILRDIPFYSGNTILGDGSVIMILDPNGIATATSEITVGSDEGGEAKVTDVSRSEEKSSMLVFRAGSDDLKAVPLALIARLEDIDMATTEKSHDQYVVQYRGNLMPLIPFNSTHEWKREGRQPLLVFTDQERSMGLVVDEIIDIVEDNLKIEIAANETGVIGTAILDGKATDIVDAGHYLTLAFNDWFSGRDGNSGDTSLRGKRILLVDDSPFFRNLLTPMLSVAGYNVTTVDSAGKALSMCEEGVDFDVIISDIEMPDMNGFEFAEAVRDASRWANVPMVALSSRTEPSDIERGRSVGFNKYVSKSDRETLIQTLSETIDSINLEMVD